MGAICGIVKGGSDALPAMAQAMRRRGALLYAGRLGACCLGQLGPRGRAWEGDVRAGGGRFVLVFDGNILNLAELRQRLERDGHRVAGTDSIADTLAVLYRVYGERFPALLDGPFALALADGERLLLARDRYGVKPLYYSRAGETLAFASEIKGIACRQPPAAFDTQSMREYFVFADHVLGDSTAFSGMKQIRAGHSVVVECGAGAIQLRSREFASYRDVEPLFPGGERDEERLASLLFAEIDRNVRHFVERAERPGVLLSGGFDSSVLAALALKYAGKRLQTFTISDDPEFPDVLAARKVAAHLGTRHHEFIVSAKAEASGWTEGIHAYEDVIYRNTIFLLAKHVAGAADLVLSGAGADYLGIPILLRGTRLEQARARWRALEAMPGQRSAADSALARRLASLREDDPGAILEHFITEYVPNQLFPSTERAMQYFGIEVAFPFASNLLHALAWRLPLGEREHDGIEKPLLRKALAGLDLPPDIKLRATFCSKENLLESKRNLSRSAAGADQAALDRAVPDEIKPLVRAKFQAVKLALLRRIFIESGGELPAESGHAIQDAAGA